MPPFYLLREVKKLKKSIIGVLVLAIVVFSGSLEAIKAEFPTYELLVQAAAEKSPYVDYGSVLVLVTYNGGGVDTLSTENFSTKLNAQIVPPGGSALSIIEVYNQGGGYYYLHVEPLGSWKSGVYHFPIIVSVPGYNAKGQTLVKLEVQ